MENDLKIAQERIAYLENLLEYIENNKDGISLKQMKREKCGCCYDDEHIYISELEESYAEHMKK